MKLLVKTSLYLLLTTLLVFGIGAVLTFNNMKEEISHETDYHLSDDINLLFGSLERGATPEALNAERISIQKLEGTGYKEQAPIYSDTLVMHPHTKKLEVHRKAVVTKKAGEDFYLISIYDSLVETDDLYDSLSDSFLRFFLLLAVMMVGVSFLISFWIFKPFNRTLSKIKSFRLQDREPLGFRKTGIREFDSLNSFISDMTEKVQLDYQNLKEFTENASHEMQTPLAIAKGKLELLLDSSDLSDEQARLIESAYGAINRLSRLGHSLSLLTKIENQEFANSQSINFSKLLDDMLFGFKELIELKEIKLVEYIKKDIFLQMDPFLADILLTNLLQNAIRHNEPGGAIEVALDNEKLVLRNTGAPPPVPPVRLFERFRKSNPSDESLGLGLAIAYQVCETSRLQLSYSFAEGWHELKVEF